MKHAKKRNNYILILAVLVVLVIIYFAAAVVAPVIQTQTMTDNILESAAKQPDVAAYINNTNYTATMKQLTREEMQDLIAEKPTIYSGMPVGIYQIIYQTNQSRAVALYDYDMKRVVKFYTE
ncbi:MAG: hypothetical protein NT120_04755 [Candidatus Aenigmarchaeota archaeon]|nr:hypothetical protein [Candidatus Aenigmarchaeota archaeon]